MTTCSGVSASSNVTSSVNGRSRTRAGKVEPGVNPSDEPATSISLDGEVPVVELLGALRALRSGDFDCSLSNPYTGVAGEVVQCLNDVILQHRAMRDDLHQLATNIGVHGQLERRAVSVGSGGWRQETESLNCIIEALVGVIEHHSEVCTSVVAGDFSTRASLDLGGRPLRGDLLDGSLVLNRLLQNLGAVARNVAKSSAKVVPSAVQGALPKHSGMVGDWQRLLDNLALMTLTFDAQVREIADVASAIIGGDLSRTVTLESRGETLRLKRTMNALVGQIATVTQQVSGFARQVGTQGRFDARMDAPRGRGVWEAVSADLNQLAISLALQLRSVTEVTTAVGLGDLSKRVNVPVEGEMRDLRDATNTLVDRLALFAEQTGRLAREVGSEGNLGGRVDVHGLSGAWRELTIGVNSMVGHLTAQLREMADVAEAIADGDLTRRVTVDAQGELLTVKHTVNGTLDQLNALASEVTRVAREVGTEGKLGNIAQVHGARGAWRELTDSVNSMVSNLTAQVRNIADVTTAVANGDLSRKITVDVPGEIRELKDTINTMVDQLNAFAEEVTRVAREVGTEGKLGGQANVRGIAGIWKDLTESVNSMASNLTSQVRNIAEVTTAVAQGDLSKQIEVDVRGEMLQLKNTINTMVDQLNAFASEVTRVAREVGTEGKLGGQAQVPGVSGTWKDLTEGVNSMASNLTSQVRNIADVTTAVARGDLSKKVTVDVRGEILELKNTVNTMVDQLNAFANEVTRVAREVGTEGELGGQAWVNGVAGTWKDLTDSVNSMASNLTSQVRNIADVTTAVARGDLSKKITVDVKGEILELKNTINTMVDQLNAFAGEVTRVAREVGTEGKLGGQARVPGVAGIWMDLTNNVNSMASNLTNQVRGIARVVAAVANGDLTSKLALDARGEIAELADTINGMTATLALFADQVITVANEVGVQGKLGGQAKVPGAAGTWRDLTDNVNELAANLTTQVRAISDVATAVTKGDLTQHVTVEASGEVASLKDRINEMIRNLKETTQKTTQQDWLKTQLARFSRMLQGQRGLETVARQTLSELAHLVSAQQGCFFLVEPSEEERVRLRCLARYAIAADGPPANLSLGEGLAWQCALDKRKIVLHSVPAEFMDVSAGVGIHPALSVTVLPVLFEGQVNGVIQLAAFAPLSVIHETFLDQFTESLGVVLNTIDAGVRTERLLSQSQLLTRGLQSQQEELRCSNERLELQASTLRESEERMRQQREQLQRTNEQLEDKAKLLELKNEEVEQGRHELEEKAAQLELASRYKSEFLANMSHELRTPLNSLLLLSKTLSDNREGNLLANQVQFARTIHSSGTDLLALINDILDLSKIESGTLMMEVSEMSLIHLVEYIEQSFRYLAQQRGLQFNVVLGDNLPECIVTDTKRLQQVLKNLLSNAFKFTEIGQVTFRVSAVSEGWSEGHHRLDEAGAVLAFAVEDTGIGIAEDQQDLIFEAFRQADGTTSRRYGGTGLGLSISRELAKLLGGELTVQSVSGIGSTFTFYCSAGHGAERVGSFGPRARWTQVRSPLTVVSDVSRVSGVEADVPARCLTTPIGLGVRTEEEVVDSDQPILLAVGTDTKWTDQLLTAARSRGYRCVVAPRDTPVEQTARHVGAHCVAFDITSVDTDAWRELYRVKRSSSLLHVPALLFGDRGDQLRARRYGAFSLVERTAPMSVWEQALDDVNALAKGLPRRLMVCLADASERHRLVELLAGDDVVIDAADSLEAMHEALRGGAAGCVLIDVALLSGEHPIVHLRQTLPRPDVPIVAYSCNLLQQGQRVRLLSEADAIVVKGARSHERVQQLAAMFLHRNVGRLPESHRRMLQGMNSCGPQLEGLKVLVVDDDVRNIFALTTALEYERAHVIHAESGRAGLEMLNQMPDVDAVLMDIMMPEMDGYETMRQIRTDARFEHLPIVAVTARAMASDRNKCIAAGASDYVSKPVDMEQLVSLLRCHLCC